MLTCYVTMVMFIFFFLAPALSNVQGGLPPVHPGYPLEPITDVAYPPALPLQGDILTIYM